MKPLQCEVWASSKSPALVEFIFQEPICWRLWCLEDLLVPREGCPSWPVNQWFEVKDVIAVLADQSTACRQHAFYLFSVQLSPKSLSWGTAEVLFLVSLWFRKSAGYRIYGKLTSRVADADSARSFKCNLMPLKKILTDADEADLCREPLTCHSCWWLPFLGRHLWLKCFFWCGWGGNLMQHHPYAMFAGHAS